MNNRFSTAGLRPAAILLLLFTSLLFAQPAAADDGWDAQISARAAAAKRGITETEEIDGSGFGLRAEVGYEIDRGATQLRIEADASVFDYTDTARATRNGFGGGISVSQKLSETLTANLLARRATNLATLEANSADQSSIRGQLQWEKDSNRIRVSAEYRLRDYDDTARSSGDGTRLSAQYNRRLGSYHWARFELVREDMTSANPQRGYARTVASADYSLPLNKHLRLRLGVEARQWQYNGRVAQVGSVSNPQGTVREDKLIAPEIGLSYGSSVRGPYALAKASYEFRQSNDERYGTDAPRFQLTVGYRF